MSSEKANAKMFNLGLIETDIQMPDAVKILECIEGTQLAQGFALAAKQTLENTEDYEYTPSNDLPMSPGMR